MVRRREYTRDILAIMCRQCGAEPLKRCHPSTGNTGMIRPIPPHAVRAHDAEKMANPEA